jgi:hypothetical protein
MFRQKIDQLMKDFGVKQEYIIQLINSNRVTFKKKMNTNDFSDAEKNLILQKYGKLLS